jgi:hypothetical protein
VFLVRQWDAFFKSGGFGVILRSRYFAMACGLLVVACTTTVVFAQTQDDIKTMERARSVYLTGPVPSSISCGVELDWDGFFQQMKIEQTDGTKARLAKLKGMKIAFVSADEDHTEVKFDAGDLGNATLTDGIRNQLQGFFQIYWSQSYGRLLVVKPGDHFELNPAAEGYVVKAARGASKVAIEMDRAYRITRTSIESPQMSAVAMPEFVSGEDGLLRLRSLDETVNLGETKMVLSLNLDYQRVGVYEVPQHIHVGLPGSVSFDYTLSGCEVKGDRGTPALKN